MDTLPTLDNLTLADDDALKMTQELSQRARKIIVRAKNNEQQLPEALLELLTQITKPLFSGGHSQVTPAGRKPAYASPATLPHAVSVSFDEVKPWKIPLTVPLLTFVLNAYPALPQARRREVLEAQFPLLIPPILNMIDDMAAASKADGFKLLILLDEAILAAKSDILKRSGLINVFFEATKPNFMLLPTLTPEDEALLVLKQLYPAALATIRAGFDVNHATGMQEKTTAGSGQESEKRQVYLKVLLRQGILASLSHLGAGTSTSFIPLTTFLVEELGEIVGVIGLPAVAHLQAIMPMLRGLLIDPFGTAAPELLMTTLKTMEVVVSICAPRIQKQWWPECLRALVGCWCNILDEEDNPKKVAELGEVKARIASVTRSLARIVDKQDWVAVKGQLLAEDEDLQDLFSGT